MSMIFHCKTCQQVSKRIIQKTSRMAFKRGSVSNQKWGRNPTFALLGTNISHPKALLKMMFLFPKWDMLVPWRVNHRSWIQALNSLLRDSTTSPVSTGPPQEGIKSKIQTRKSGLNKLIEATSNVANQVGSTVNSNSSACFEPAILKL